MKNIMGIVEDFVLRKVAIYNPVNDMLAMREDMSHPPADTGIEYKLQIAWGNKVICRDSTELQEAKVRIVESYRRFVYKDLLLIMDRLSHALYRNDAKEAKNCLEELYKEVEG